jgi:hypothetical protein
MDSISEIIEQQNLSEPLVVETNHHHHSHQHHHHNHHHQQQTQQQNHHHHQHNGSVVMVNTQTGQLIGHRHEMNNNGEWIFLVNY